ncbi:MAG: cobaltochelatase subunit CobN, partial [Deltaproteobacteria bacterium]|nr:cobaltochelatase subunit CobN [Deltaproteobacteria bacterium]
MNICIVAVGASALIETESIVGTWKTGTRAGLVALTTHYVGSDTLSQDDWPGIFRSIFASDFVLLDTMGVPAAFDEALTEGLAGYKGQLAVVNATSLAVRSMTRLGRFSLSMMKSMGRKDKPFDAGRMMKMVDRLERLGRALPVGPLRDMRNFFWISRYWLAGGRGNLENMLLLIGREYFGCKKLPKPAAPVAVADCSILDPAGGRIFKSIAEFHRAYPPAADKPGLGLLFRSRPYPLNTHPVMARVMASLSRHFNVLPVALDSTVGRDFNKLRNLLAPPGRPAIDVLVNPESFRLAQGPLGGDAAAGERFLRALDVPVLHPFFLTKRTREQWLSDARGAGTGEFLISIFLPELDGCLDMYPIGAVATLQHMTPQLGPIEDRI